MPQITIKPNNQGIQVNGKNVVKDNNGNWITLVPFDKHEIRAFELYQIHNNLKLTMCLNISEARLKRIHQHAISQQSTN